MTESFPSMEAPLQHLMMMCLPSAACTLHQTVKGLGSEEPASMPLVLGHFPVVFGVVCGLLHVSKDLVDRIFLKMFTRDLVSAAVRLGIVGPIEGVRVQARSFEQLERLLRTDLRQLSIEGTDRSDASSEDWSDGCIHFYKNIRPTQTAPTIDLLQSRHDQLYSRLFNS
jgi:urease accessory protein